MYNVKIIGAGSIGNHLAHASRSLGWNVTVCDIDSAALDRTKSQIYPTRYGSWDKNIQLCLIDDVPKGKFDLIIIGTPPDSHIPLALDVCFSFRQTSARYAFRADVHLLRLTSWRKTTPSLNPIPHHRSRRWASSS